MLRANTQHITVELDKVHDWHDRLRDALLFIVSSYTRPEHGDINGVLDRVNILVRVLCVCACARFFLCAESVFAGADTNTKVNCSEERLALLPPSL